MGIGDGMHKRANARPRGRLIVPMDWGEDPARDLRGGYFDPKHGTPMRRAHPGEAVPGEAEPCGIFRVYLDEWIGGVACEFRRKAGPRHRVPLVAHPPGVQKERKGRVRRLSQDRLLDGYEAGPARGREEAPGREHAFFSAWRTSGRWPLQRRERVVTGVAKRREAAKIKVSGSIVLECRERGMFAEDRGRARIIERGAKAHPLGG